MVISNLQQFTDSTWEGYLYVFYEIFCFADQVGKISAYRTKDLETYEDLGIILSEPHHLSFPFLFRGSDEVFLIPESVQAHEVTLYRFDAFPYRPQKLRTLVHGDFVDSFLLFKEGTYFLFATSPQGQMNVFCSDDLLEGDFLPHPCNPICVDPRYSRSGGGPLMIEGNWFRVAQDCSESFGRNLSLIKITQLSKTAYEEQVETEQLVTLNKGWNGKGSHHLSMEFYNNQWVSMIDGIQNDYFFLPMQLTPLTTHSCR